MPKKTAKNGGVSIWRQSGLLSWLIPKIDLGKANTMPMATAGGNALMTISYWKDIEHLHAFAHGPTHRLGWDWWAAENKKYPHLGIMHETYAVPEGGWENIYHNFQPFGMGEPTLPETCV